MSLIFSFLSSQGFVDRESRSGDEHHSQHLQSHPEVSRSAHRTALGAPAGGAGASRFHCHAAVLQHLQVLLQLPVQR